ncbi:hypothetical protein LINPERHAP2_LOCUS20732 [Linum perenne]
MTKRLICNSMNHLVTKLTFFSQIPEAVLQLPQLSKTVQALNPLATTAQSLICHSYQG